MIKFAWRNIWRNKRRTLITLLMVQFAVFLAVLHRSLLWGMYNLMIEQAAGTYYGYGQIHKEGYWEDRSIENIFSFNDSLRSTLEKSPGVKTIFPRIESFALASSGNISRPSILMGIDPEGENQLSGFNKKITAGQALQPGDQSVLLGEGLAERLKLKVGDTLILLSQGYHAISSAGKYPVKGLINFGNPKINRMILFMPLKEAQWFYGTEDKVTTAVIVPEYPSEREWVVAEIGKQLGKGYEAMTWEQLDKETIQAIQADSASGMLLLFILYIIVGFGIFSTVLMMTAERRNEFGMLIALGMRKGRLGFMLMTETLFISMLGVAIGMVMALPIISYFVSHPIRITGDLGAGLERMGFEPIIVPALDLSIFIYQAAIVFILTLVISFFPFLSVRKSKPVPVLRS